MASSSSSSSVAHAHCCAAEQPCIMCATTAAATHVDSHSDYHCGAAAAAAATATLSQSSSSSSSSLITSRLKVAAALCKKTSTSSAKTSDDFIKLTIGDDLSTRKYSAPLSATTTTCNATDSGVYVGEPAIDPILERWHCVCQRHSHHFNNNHSHSDTQLPLAYRSVGNLTSSSAADVDVNAIDVDDSSSAGVASFAVGNQKLAKDAVANFRKAEQRRRSSRDSALKLMMKSPRSERPFRKQTAGSYSTRAAAAGGSMSATSSDAFSQCNTPPRKESGNPTLIARSHSSSCVSDYSTAVRGALRKISQPVRRVVTGLSGMKFGTAERQDSSDSDQQSPAQPAAAAAADVGASKASSNRQHADSVSKKIAMWRRNKPGRAGSSSASTPSVEHAGINIRVEAARWAESFENLLHSKHGVQLFRLFLQREFSDENIEFWLACEDYRSLKNSQQIAQRARQIYAEFVAIQSPKEVNLDSKTREITMSNLVSPTSKSFEQAQARILSLMEKDSYQRFLKSEVYLDLLKQ